MVTIFHDSIDDPTSIYKISNLDTEGDTKYFGYVNSEGGWYIMKLTSIAATYVKGDSEYSTNWDLRAGVELSYDTFDNIF